LTRSSPKRLYLIPVLSKALDILELLQKEKKPLPLEAIYQRTSISKTTVYRILKTSSESRPNGANEIQSL